MKKQHLFKITNYLNAHHTVHWDDIPSHPHHHAWEIVTYIGTNDQKSFPPYRFTEIEDRLTQVLAPFSQTNLNSIPPFDKVNPTLENFTEQLFTAFSSSLPLDCKLISLEVSESPTRSCVIDLDH